MIYSGETLDAKGELSALSYEPAAVEITLWGEVSKAEKQQRIAMFLKGLEGLPLSEKLHRAFLVEQRRADMKEGNNSKWIWRKNGWTMYFQSEAE